MRLCLYALTKHKLTLFLLLRQYAHIPLLFYSYCAIEIALSFRGGLTYLKYKKEKNILFILLQINVRQKTYNFNNSTLGI